MSQKRFILLISVLISSLLLAACGGTTSVRSNQATAAANGPDADGDGIPDNAEKLLGTDPNQLQVEATVYAKGFAPQIASIKKDASDAETGTD